MSAVYQIFGYLKKYPLAITCLVIFAAGGALSFVRGGQIADLAVEEESLNARQRVIERNVRNASDLKDDLEQVQAAVEVMQSRLFRRDERAVNANFFYDMEDLFDVRISQIKQQAEGYPFYAQDGIHELKLHSTIVYSIGLVGQMESILSFVHQLKEVDPFIRVVNLRLVSGNQNAVAGNLECSLTLVVLSELESK